jgi:hypothetical protein
VLPLYREVNGVEHPDTLKAMINLSTFYATAGRREEALKLREEVLTLCNKVLGPQHRDTLKAMYNLAQSYGAAGRLGEALKLREELLPRSREVNGPDHPDTLESLQTLAGSYRVEQRYAEAEPLLREYIQRRKARYSSTNDIVVSAVSSMAGLLYDWAWSERRASDKTNATQRAHEAEDLLRDCLTTRANTLRPGSSRLAETRSQLGGALVAVAVLDSTLSHQARLARLTEAESLLLNAHEALRQGQTASPTDKHDALERLVRLYEAWDKPEQLAEWRMKLAELEKARLAN